MNAQINNFVGIYENAFPADYCNDVIKQYNILEQQGFTKNRQQLESATKTVKDDTAFWTGNFYNSECSVDGMHELIGKKFNDVFQECYDHYANEFSVLKDASENHGIWGHKVQRTNIGQGYHIWHYESSNRLCSSRILTYILYLNDVEEGGETELLYEKMRIKPKQGTLLIFPAAFTHTHRGNPPYSNDKYIITGWVEF